MSKISIIVPVYNSEKYLGRCIESILGQTFDNFELILVDDGSTDNSLQICSLYAEKDSRIKVIHKKNGGTSDARNTGLAAATGNYITFMDNDDYALTTWLEKMYLATDNEKYDIVKGGFYTAYPEQPQHLKDEGGIPVMEERNLRHEIKTSADFIHYMSMDYGNGCDAVWNQLVRRQLFENVQFPVGKLSEDFYVCYKLCRKTDSLATIPQTGYCWVIYQSSQSHSISDEKLIGHICVRRECLEYLWQIGDTQAAQSLCRQLWQNFRVAFPQVSAAFTAGQDYKTACEHLRANKTRYMESLTGANKIMFSLWLKAPSVLKTILNLYRKK